MRLVGPTFTKRYNVRPTLEHRVFIPSSYDAGSTMPLYLSIHGGGFAIGDPQMDDFFCKQLAERAGICVVSLNYRKAPSHPFPDPVNDLVVVIKAVLSDKSLPIDHSKIAGGGFSAGGNLILSATQDPELRRQFKGIIPIYPVVDFSNRYRGPFRTTKDGRVDMLKNMGAWFNWGYLPLGEDLSDPLLSPIYASRKALPDKIFFIGAEYDCLCQEANTMALRLAEVSAGDSSIHQDDWNHNGIKWRMFRDVQHGFTHVSYKGDEESHRQTVMKDFWTDITTWLKEEVF